MLPLTSPQVEHSTGDLRCQSRIGPQSSPATAPANTDGKLAQRYGAEVLASGYTAVPNLLLQRYSQLGITTAELVCVQHLLSYWWNRQLPHPAIGTIAQRMGKSVRQVQHYIESLRRKGLLRVVERLGPEQRRLTNAYDLQPLLDALCVSPGVAKRETRRDEVEGARVARHAAPVHIPTPVPMKDPAPEEDPSQQEPDLDSMTPYPHSIATRVEASPSESRPDRTTPSEQTRQWIAQIGGLLGDQAPGASATRIRGLQDRSKRTDPEFRRLCVRALHQTLTHHDDVHGRGADGHPNAMPYFFATLEALLRPATSHPPRPERNAEPTVVPITHRSDPHLVTVPEDVHPVWRAVLLELQETLPPRTFLTRLAPARAASFLDNTLRVRVPTAFGMGWLDRMLGRRIQEILDGKGHTGVRVVFELEGDAPET